MANPARASLTDLANLGPAQSRISPWVSANLSAAQQFLNVGSDYLDGILAAKFDLPLIPPYPQDVIDFEVVYACYRIILRLGFSPQSAIDQMIKKEYDEKIAWARLIADDKITPNATDSSSDGAEGGPFVTSSTSRGYSERGFAGLTPPIPRAAPFSDD